MLVTKRIFIFKVGNSKKAINLELPYFKLETYSLHALLDSVWDYIPVRPLLKTFFSTMRTFPKGTGGWYSLLNLPTFPIISDQHLRRIVQLLRMQSAPNKASYLCVWNNSQSCLEAPDCTCTLISLNFIITITHILNTIIAS